MIPTTASEIPTSLGFQSNRYPVYSTHVLCTPNWPRFIRNSATAIPSTTGFRVRPRNDPSGFALAQENFRRTSCPSDSGSTKNP